MQSVTISEKAEWSLSLSLSGVHISWCLGKMLHDIQQGPLLKEMTALVIGSHHLKQTVFRLNT